MADIVAVALVVDSSLTLAADWPFILNNYIFPLLQRLHEAYANHQSRLAVITYATAETRPSPLVAKRFFTPLQLLIKELAEEAPKLGIGLTGSGGDVGMAVLEGMTAALELFDQLQAACQRKPLVPQAVNQPIPKSGPQISASHIIHVAAAPPDPSQHPLWNSSPKLDRMSWDNLPMQLQKRKIQWSLMLLQPLPRLKEYYSKAVTSPLPPWFSPRPEHTILLTGFPQKVVKRPAEAQASPDTKRAKIFPPATTPSAPHTSPNNKPVVSSSDIVPLAAPSASTIVPSQPPAPALQPPQASPLIAQAHPRSQAQLSTQQIVERIKSMDAEIKVLGAKMQEAKMSGNEEEAERLRKELEPKTLVFTKARQSFAQYVHQMQNQGQARSGPPASSNPVNPQASTNPASSSAEPVQIKHEPPSLPDSQMPVQSQHARHSSNPFPGMSSASPSGSQSIPGILPNAPPGVTAQMHKLVDQHRNLRPQQPAPAQQPPPAQPSASTFDQATAGLLPGQQPRRHRWEGVIHWGGVDPTTQVRKDLNVEVAVEAPKQSDLQMENWPQTLDLSPAPLGTMTDISAFLKRVGAVGCLLSLHSRALDAKLNERFLQMFSGFLKLRGLYAMASWRRPTDTRQSNLLLFVMADGKLVTVFFFSAGPPDMPKPPPKIDISKIDLSKLPPDVLAHLQTLTPDARRQYLQDMLRRHLETQRQQQQQQQQQQQRQMLQQQPDPSMNNGMNPLMLAAANQSMNGMNNLLGPMMGQPGSASNPINVNMGGAMGQPQLNMGGGFPQAQPNRGQGPMGNVSYEMLQSFMQRNADGSMLPGMEQS
ncbi:hypothetical protein JAAARDRAFT_33941 [Jaapia argillacea MUCL 33604]|uniref:Mediator of RNA polymerase II transcription subunit 25 von Willebrand factor type A domain-containing protein n=1 Tax=Jaapia argillacea MUCL 33604 TaxID=933084 RepID=A0A067PWV9_9AGAM|nr:hypothetical protein JAAARDRAFT_33941 [Jaapia argillacea MUCL 33604]